VAAALLHCFYKVLPNGWMGQEERLQACCTATRKRYGFVIAEMSHVLRLLEFYMRSGWNAKPAPAIVLPVSSSTDYSYDNPIDRRLKALHAEDIEGLCTRDVEALREDMRLVKSSKNCSIVTILPTSDLVSWLHVRAEFMGIKIHHKSPSNKGAIYGSEAWIYWHHDFRKQCLFIQRIRAFVEHNGTRVEVLAALLLHAIREAKTWQLLTVVTWETGPDVCKAVELLRSRIRDCIPILVTNRRETISLRWKSGQKKEDDVKIVPNEHYGWN
jgi:hypothetical protein